jgi:hypothetical protein
VYYIYIMLPHTLIRCACYLIRCACYLIRCACYLTRMAQYAEVRVCYISRAGYATTYAHMLRMLPHTLRMLPHTHRSECDDVKALLHQLTRYRIRRTRFSYATAYASHTLHQLTRYRIHRIHRHRIRFSYATAYRSECDDAKALLHSQATETEHLDERAHELQSDLRAAREDLGVAHLNYRLLEDRAQAPHTRFSHALPHTLRMRFSYATAYTACTQAAQDSYARPHTLRMRFSYAIAYTACTQAAQDSYALPHTLRMRFSYATTYTACTQAAQDSLAQQAREFEEQARSLAVRLDAEHVERVQVPHTLRMLPHTLRMLPHTLAVRLWRMRR